MGWVDDWSAQAACRTTDPGELFVQGAAQNRSKGVCSGCPVRTECLADALDNRVEFGIWGGMTERERRALLRRRPTVVSWRRTFELARREYELSLADNVEREFEVLFRAEFGNLVGFLVAAGARLVEAQDAAQMAFVEILRKWSAVTSRIAWLRSVAYRMWVRLIRKDRIHILEASPAPPDTTVTGDLELGLQARQVIELLAELPPQQRTTMALVYDGRSPTEIAGILEVSAASVRQNLKRARSTLARLIVERGILPCPNPS